MFKFNHNTRIDTSGIGKAFTKALTIACVAGLMEANAYSQSIDHHEQLLTQDSVFSNFETNDMLKKEAENTVFIVVRSKDHHYVNYGTGVIIKDSGVHDNMDSPYNKILTSRTTIFPNNSENIQWEPIRIFDSTGNPLAIGQLDAFSSLEDQMDNSVVTLSVKNPTPTYLNKEGVTLATDMPNYPFEIINTTGMGAGPGFSGSPIFNTKGQLVGLSTALVYDSNQNQRQAISEYAKEGYKMVIPKENGTKLLTNEQEEGNLKNDILVNTQIIGTPISDKHILQSLHKEGSVRITPKLPENVTIFGYTNSLGVVKTGQTQDIGMSI